jgi:hypothetical protein
MGLFSDMFHPDVCPMLEESEFRAEGIIRALVRFRSAAVCQSVEIPLAFLCVGASATEEVIARREDRLNVHLLKSGARSNW